MKKQLVSIFVGVMALAFTSLTSVADPIILAIPSGGGTTLNVPKISVTNLEVFGTFNATNFNAITNIVYYAGTTAYASNGIAYVGTNSFGGISNAMTNNSFSINGTPVGTGSNVTITAGGGWSGLFTVISTNGNYTVTTNDCNKMIVYTGTGTNTFSLPSVGSGDLGNQFWLVKTGTGKLIIAATNGSRIADSGANGTIYNASTNETYATMHLMLAATNQWAVGGFFGTWTTTSP